MPFAMCTPAWRRAARLCALSAMTALVAGTAACSHGSTPTDAQATTLGSVGSSPSADEPHTEDGPDRTPPAGLTPLGNADTERKTERPKAPNQLVVTKIRTGHHKGFDRVVFEFVGQGEPGWFVDYTDRPTQQASGHVINYTGTTALNVNIDGTAYPFEAGVEDTAPTHVDGIEDGNVTEVISAGMFEGRAQYIVGLGERVPYSVQVLQGPTRLVIDLVR
ncbi:AMIN-like domain-containing (lipo)protein [Corynebacterium uberis]|uniref:AMIN-like domain-containing (lipo)protein n=1 Tax=Corynebacterium TaxID=1716 RepID=UPI001D0BE03D|nr:MULTISPECIES: hypothetical protein [Corynebacterium]MCZ9309309.1 hypothetical protein [Corynebacterium sp. c6VSa_13]UDL72860.1 hypothetical protein LH391_06990 [Corynebacterium uberis]UDL76262.1 hypothetical protein LH393_02405 [Corynebacterium uberis]UDL78475.1 hypothetical protein LH394_02395 [Corynebacterium uberis]UDL82893.1 hypothetical protein LH395_02400 [Corynebacterium uberis]